MPFAEDKLGRDTDSALDFEHTSLSLNESLCVVLRCRIPG